MLLCQRGGTKKNALRRTEAGVTSLADNLLRYQKAGQLEFDVSNDIEFQDGEPDFLQTFLKNNAQYHHNCTSPF